MRNEEAILRIKEKIRREAGPVVLQAIEDDSVIEILLNPDGNVWIERLGKEMVLSAQMSPSQSESLISTIASFAGIAIGPMNPLLECEFPLDGSRFTATLPPVVSFPSFSLRKKAIKLFTLQDYVDSGALTEQQFQTIQQAIQEQKNIVIVGSTASGKTTFGNAVLHTTTEIHPHRRLIILEDTVEIQCNAPNVVAMKKPANKSMDALLRHTLRLRPDSIIVGEVRGKEVKTLLKAWNTGHNGGLVTIHANGAKAALIRIEQMIAEGKSQLHPGYIAEAVHLIVVISKASGQRKITEIAELQGFEGGHYILKMR
jgi:P-type conjugative transfer ATPase TrbB